MEKFISVAIGAVAGEGHEVQDRLSDLRIVCSRFSVLLYNVPCNEEAEIGKVMNCIWRSAEKLKDPSTDIDKLIVRNNNSTILAAMSF